MLELHDFDEGDFAQLIAAMPDARSHLQWAGPEYTYPLTADQLRATMSQTTGEAPTFRMYKAVFSDTKETVGHVQLMDIDYACSSCVLGKVLVLPLHRGSGLARTLVALALDEAFVSLALKEMTLMVFDFNQAAIATYESLRFVPFPPHPGPLPFQGESWHALRMRLTKERWLERTRDPI